MRLVLPATVMACLMVMPVALMAQTTTNPRISLIGDFRVFSHDDNIRSAEAEELNLADPEVELFISGYLNPYARAAGTIAWHPGADAEIEEVYAEFVRGLPLNSQVRAGKYLLEFGRLNPLHPHAWSFIQRPLPHFYFLGDHGLTDVAVRASFLLPTGDIYTEVMGAALKGDALLGHEHEHEEDLLEISLPRDPERLALQDEHDLGEEAERVDLGFFGRLTGSVAVGDYAELAVGISALNSVSAVHEHAEAVKAIYQVEEPEQLRSWVNGVDIKYKYVPSRYTALLIEAEGLWRADESESGDYVDSYGGFGYVDYRFRQRYNVGGIFEYVMLTARHEEMGAVSEESQDIWRAGLFVGFAPVEETSLLRLVGHWTEPEARSGFWELTLQLVFSLGPHQPHNF